MELELKNGQKSAAFHLSDVTDYQFEAILNRTFSFLEGTQAPEAPTPPAPKEQAPEIKVTVNVEPGRAQTTGADVTQRSVQKTMDQLKESMSRARVLPKVNDERKFSSSIGERLGLVTDPDPLPPLVEEKIEPDYFKTGIQYRDWNGEQVPTYKTSYFCPNGHQGRRYVKEDATFVFCHSCSKRLKIRDAHKDGFPNRDTFGNFYIADVPYETPDPFIEAVTAKLPEIQEEEAPADGMDVLRTLRNEVEERKEAHQEIHEPGLMDAQPIPPYEAPKESEQDEDKTEDRAPTEEPGQPSEDVLESRPKKRGRPKGSKSKTK